MDKRFNQSRSLFATDKVPPTIFGIPVVSRREDYTEADLEFFRRHPEAGGYYSMGDETEEEQGAIGAGNSVVEKLKRRIGDTGSVVDAGLAWIERQHKQAIDMNIPVVSKVTEAVLQPAVLGARVAVANATSGGGKYYQPEVRDERYFSNNALKELGSSIAAAKGRTFGRADGMDNAAQFNLTQTLGGFTISGGKVTDKFDINQRYTGVPQPLTNVARAVLGKEEDPDRGKVRTEIPLSKIPGTQGALGAGSSVPYVTLPSGSSFSSLFESKPVAVKGKDGKTYYRPTKDKAGKYDIGGYRSYWSATQGKLVAHSNDGLLPEKAYLDGKKRIDAYFGDVTNRVFSKYGVDPKSLGKGLDTAARDIVFNTGGDDFLNNSPKFAKIVTALKDKGMSANDAFGVALALEQDSYGWQNDRRFAARGGLVMDELSKSQNPTVRRFTDAYRTGWGSVKDYGYRNDGKTRKGTGWLGELKTSDGGVATEYTSQSNAVKVNGKRIDFPTLVPTLSKDEIRMMTDDIIPNHKAVPDAIMQKAVDHALLRLKNGKSVFANDGPSNTGMEDAYGTNWERHKAGMREASRIADELGLDYTARGNK